MHIVCFSVVDVCCVRPKKEKKKKITVQLVYFVLLGLLPIDLGINMCVDEFFLSMNLIVLLALQH